jgi:protein-disulfide isomerase
MPVRALLPALLLAAAIPAAAPAFDLASMTPEEREAFRAEVRSYLIDNPEVLVEAINILEARKREVQAAADTSLIDLHAAAIFEDGHSWVGGNPDGDITLVEFMDYRCGYCRQAFAEVAELLAADGNIRFVVKEYPILGEQSLMAARFAIAAHQLHGDAAYESLHDALMTLRTDITPDSLSRLAETLGFDPAPILARMESPEVAAVIEANHRLGRQMQITGTPTFVLGNRMLRGYAPVATMQDLVAAARADQG